MSRISKEELELLRGTYKQPKTVLELAIHNTAEELKRFRDLEEQGRLIELPCECWGQLYHVCWINGKYVIEPLVVVGFSGSDVDDLEIQVMRIYHSLAKMKFSIGAIGVSIFATKEEAEEALKRLQGNE